MAENGWIKLHRKIRKNILWNKKPFSKGQAWVDLLLRASHDNHKIFVGNKPIELKRGQVFISKKGLARDWGWSRTKVTNFLNVLEGKNRNKNNQMLTTSEPLCKNETQKKTRLGIIITLTNYEFYQTGVKKKDIEKDIEKTSKRHLKDTPPISNDDQKRGLRAPKNYKNEKNVKKKPYKYTPDDLRLTKKLKENILQINPGQVFRGEAWEEKNAEQIRLMRHYDKRASPDIEAVINFAFRDKFWSGIIQSVFSLRKNYDMMKTQIRAKLGETETQRLARELRKKAEEAKND